MNSHEESPKFPTRRRLASPEEKHDTRVLPDATLNVAPFLARRIHSGMLLHQHYQIMEEVGQGGMGQIWKAKDLKAKNQQSSYVAVKRVLIPPNYPNPEELKQRFLRECIFLTTIKHHNLVTGIEYFEEDDDCFLIMEWIPGVPLNTFLEKQQKIFSFIEQVAIAYQICRGFEVLHLAGVLHRDIKPANIMVNPNTGIVKILDLGLAKSLVKRIGNEVQTLTQMGAILGTADYMSPEQLEGDCSAYSDMFGIGVLLYQFFAWMPQSPFRAHTLIDTLENVQKNELPPLQDRIIWPHSAQEAKCYQSLGKILDQCLQKNPAQRLHDDGILIRELELIYQKLSKLSSNLCGEQWKLKTLSQQIDHQGIKQFRSKYAEDYSHHRSRTRRQNLYAKKNTHIQFFFLGILLVLFVLGAWNFIFSPVLPTSSNTPSTPTQLPASFNPPSTTSNTPISSNTPEGLTPDNILALGNNQSLQDIISASEITEKQLLEQKVNHLKIKEKMSQVAKLRDQAKAQSNKQLENQYQLQLSNLYYQDQDLDDALQTIYEVPSHTPESLLQYAKIAKEAAYYTHHIYAIRLFLQKFPQHPQCQAMKQELASVEQNLNNEMNASDIPDTGKTLRKLLYELGYLSVAQWDFDDPYVQEYITDIQRIIPNQFPELMPWLGCMRILRYIHNNQYQQAQSELNRLKQPQPHQLKISFMSLYNGYYVWPEITYVEGVLAFAQGNHTAAMSKFDLLKSNVQTYPINEGNPLAELAKFYDNFNSSAWKQQLRHDMTVFVKILAQRTMMNLHLAIQKSQDINSIITAFQDLLFIEKMKHLIHFRLGILLYQTKQYDMAEKNLIHAQKLNNGLYEATFYLGLIYYANQRWTEAEHCFRFCTVFQPVWTPQMGELSRKYLQELETRKQKPK